MTGSGEEQTAHGMAPGSSVSLLEHPLQQKLHTEAARTVYLAPDDSWVTRYYDPSTPSYKQRLLFR